jgi:UDP-2-acetamido-3-amino-2,3-dideoxy-glucuronate N-acetyltransferase
VVCGVEIGRYALLAAGAVVIRDVPDHAMVAGNPATIKGWYSKAGARLKFPAQGSAKATCPLTQESYELVGETCRPSLS